MTKISDSVMLDAQPEGEWSLLEAQSHKEFANEQ